MRLSSIYWFTVEFGMVQDKVKQEPKVMGAGILSSFGEMEWSASLEPSEECRVMGGVARDYPDLKKPRILSFDPRAAAAQPYPITTYQPVLFCCESLSDLKEKIQEYCDTLERKFHPIFDPLTQSVTPSRHIRRLPRSTTAGLQAEKQREYFDQVQKSKELYNISSVADPPFVDGV